MKVPTPAQLPSGRWFVRLRLGGQEYANTFDTEKEATAWATLVKSQHVAGVLPEKLPAEKMTVRQLMQEYIDQNTLSHHTAGTYRSAMQRFSQLMDTPYDRIRNWQKHVNIELEYLNPNTVAEYWHKITAALRFHGLDVPSVKIPKVPSKRKNWLDNDEIDVFREMIRGHKFEAWFLLMLSSCRVSEALAVRREDISEKGIHVHGTKTQASDRVIPWMIPRLQELCRTWDFSSPPSHTALADSLRKISRRMHVPELSCHSLRVSFVSVCYHKQVPAHIVMQIGGWSSPDVVHRHYLRIYQEDVDRWAQEVSDVFS